MGCRKCCQQSQPQSQTGWRKTRFYPGSCYGPSNTQTEVWNQDDTQVRILKWYPLRVKIKTTHPIPIKCSTKIIMSIFHAVNQICCIHKVRIGVLTSKVLHRDTVNGRTGRTTQLITQDLRHIWSNHCRPDKRCRKEGRLVQVTGEIRPNTEVVLIRLQHKHISALLCWISFRFCFRKTPRTDPVI